MEKRIELQCHNNHQGIGSPGTQHGMPGFFMPARNAARRAITLLNSATICYYTLICLLCLVQHRSMANPLRLSKQIIINIQGGTYPRPRIVD